MRASLSLFRACFLCSVFKKSVFKLVQFRNCDLHASFSTKLAFIFSTKCIHMYASHGEDYSPQRTLNRVEWSLAIDQTSDNKTDNEEAFTDTESEEDADDPAFEPTTDAADQVESEVRYIFLVFFNLSISWLLLTIIHFFTHWGCEYSWTICQ